jgi:hypothetical protein
LASHVASGAPALCSFHFKQQSFVLTRDGGTLASHVASGAPALCGFHFRQQSFVLTRGTKPDRRALVAAFSSRRGWWCFSRLLAVAW